MFYIVTYATHNEGYYKILKQSYPDIIVLGFGEKWINWKQRSNAIINFCKDKDPNDIICVIDGFDSVVLSSAEEILKKFKKLNYDIIFSKDLNPNNIIIKYILNKMFGSCNNINISAGMYIGKAYSIIHFWNDLKENDDDQTFATQQCKTFKNFGIDTENILFYNYSPKDKINIIDNRLEINNQKPCVISAPGNFDIYHILEKLGYNNIPTINIRYGHQLKFTKYYIPEILFIIISILMFYFVKDKNISIPICIILFLELIHYELYVKHIEQTNFYKIIYVILDLFHLSINAYIFYLAMNFKCDMNKLLLLNTIYFIAFVSLLYFKKCILTSFKNKLINVDENYSNITENQRFNYLINLDKKYKPHKNNNIDEWINENKISLLIILIGNLYCLYNINYR